MKRSPAYGPDDSRWHPMYEPWWHPIDTSDPQRAEEDDRDWGSLVAAERRARLAALPHADLVDEALSFAEDAENWKARFYALERSRK